MALTIITKTYNFETDSSDLEDTISALPSGAILEAVYIKALSEIVFNGGGEFKLGYQNGNAAYVPEVGMQYGRMNLDELYYFIGPFPKYIGNNNSNLILTIPPISSGQLKVWVKYIDQ